MAPLQQPRVRASTGRWQCDADGLQIARVVNLLSSLPREVQFSRRNAGTTSLDALEMLSQRGLHPFRQHRASIFVTFALANEELAVTRK